jgi:hypothetical protein
MPQGHLVSAADDVKQSPCEVRDGKKATRAEDVATQRTHMISGEVLRMENGSYLVREQSGKEVTLKTDERTNQPEINQGDRISADVDDQDYAVWIRSNKMTDRLTEHASGDCDPN